MTPKSLVAILVLGASIWALTVGAVIGSERLIGSAMIAGALAALYLFTLNDKEGND